MNRTFGVLFLLIASPCAAMDPISPDQFLDVAAGKTLTFRVEPTGDLVGVEQFLNRGRSVWARANGTCAYGTVSVQGPRLCFAYDDDPGRQHCWLTYVNEGALMVGMPEAMEVQRVSEISEIPVSCTDVPLS